MSISCHGQPHFDVRGPRRRSIYLTLFNCGNISNLELRNLKGKDICSMQNTPATYNSSLFLSVSISQIHY